MTKRAVPDQAEVKVAAAVAGEDVAEAACSMPHPRKIVQQAYMRVPPFLPLGHSALARPPMTVQGQQRAVLAQCEYRVAPAAVPVL